MKPFTNSCLKTGVGIILDDIEPSKVRGARSGSTIEDLKALCEVTTATSIHSRYRDIQLDENEPRIFTANAKEPSEWHSDLPEDVWSTSDSVREKYDMNIKAVFKRTCFAFVKHSVVSQNLRDDHDVKRRRRA